MKPTASGSKPRVGIVEAGMAGGAMALRILRGADGSMAILIVDDDPEIREVLDALLSDEGYTVANARNGAEAIAYLQQPAQPCVILLDLMMPQMNGWQFLQKQQADPRLAPIPVIILSAVEDAQEAAALGAAAYLPKPFKFDTLLQIVARYCPDARESGPIAEPSR